jgi:hypothetical protein
MRHTKSSLWHWKIWKYLFAPGNLQCHCSSPFSPSESSFPLLWHFHLGWKKHSKVRQSQATLPCYGTVGDGDYKGIEFSWCLIVQPSCPQELQSAGRGTISSIPQTREECFRRQCHSPASLCSQEVTKLEGANRDCRNSWIKFSLMLDLFTVLS